MMNSPIIEFDVHGMRTEDAVAAIQKKVDQAGTAVYPGRVQLWTGTEGKAHHNGRK